MEKNVFFLFSQGLDINTPCSKCLTRNHNNVNVWKLQKTVFFTFFTQNRAARAKCNEINGLKLKKKCTFLKEGKERVVASALSLSLLQGKVSTLTHNNNNKTPSNHKLETE